MKALLHIDDDDGRLRLILHSEGRNDDTLLRMLEGQYPAVIRTKVGGQFQIPIAEPYRKSSGSDPDPGDRSPALQLDFESEEILRGYSAREYVTAISDVTIRGARVDLSDVPQGCDEPELRINGREEKHPTFDVYPGYEVCVSLMCSSGPRRKFAVRIVAPSPSTSSARRSDTLGRIRAFLETEAKRKEGRRLTSICLWLGDGTGTSSRIDGRKSLGRWDTSDLDDAGALDAIASEILGRAEDATHACGEGSHGFEIMTMQALGSRIYYPFRIEVPDPSSTSTAPTSASPPSGG